MSLVLKEFESQIEAIEDQWFRKFVIKVLENGPDYIMRSASSSTGKYHPADEISSMGMKLHINRCLVAAEEFSRSFELNRTEHDILVAGCITHDLFKKGKEEGRYTSKKHPKLVYLHIKKMFEDVPASEKTDANTMFANYFANVCLFHEGIWTVDDSRAAYFTYNTVAPSEPCQKLCKIMHLSDYVASRRSLYDSMNMYSVTTEDLYKCMVKMERDYVQPDEEDIKKLFGMSKDEYYKMCGHLVFEKMSGYLEDNLLFDLK